MTRRIPLLVFSDLDGTLLDHESYSFDAARPALDALQDIGGGLILATSKTAAEVGPLRDAIGCSDWPAIVENGGGLLPAGADAGDATGDYDTIRSRLSDLPKGFLGFGDMTVMQVSDATGLPLDAARQARTRLFSEPGLWQGDDAALKTFIETARDHGLAARRGGRFLTLSLGGTKADRMDELIAKYRPRHTIALGDAPNDLEMLEKADHGVIVKNSGGTELPTLSGEARGRIRRTQAEGPAGWAEAMIPLLAELNLMKDQQTHG